MFIEINQLIFIWINFYINISGGAHISTDIVFNEDNTQVISGYEDVVNFIRKAIKCGINYIDTSPLYGQGKAEVVLGKVSLLTDIWNRLFKLFIFLIMKVINVMLFRKKYNQNTIKTQSALEHRPIGFFLCIASLIILLFRI